VPRLSAVTAAVAVSALAGLVASPYLAGLTRTVPERGARRWYRSARVSQRRCAAVAGLATAMGVLAGIAAGWSALLPAYLALALAGAPLAVIDIEHRRLPTRVVHPAALGAGLLLAVAAAESRAWDNYLRAALAAVVAAAVFAALAVATPKVLGWGDVRLAGVLGANLGYASWPLVYSGLFAGFVLAAVIAIVLIVAGRATRKTALPLGPMLLLGTLAVLALHGAGVLAA
jgi:leader peptidase (prepilin peptidase)/N-methyltransferase